MSYTIKYMEEKEVVEISEWEYEEPYTIYNSNLN